MSQTKQMDGDSAKAFAGEEFERRHPRETWPDWLKPRTVVSYGRDQQGRFIVSFALSHDEPIRADEHWEASGDRRRLVRVNPATLERTIIYRTPRAVEVYFEVAVDSATADVTVLVDTGFPKLGDRI